MDLKGHRKVEAAIKAGMNDHEDVWIFPKEWEFNDYEGEDTSACRFDAVGYLDIQTDTSPYVVLEALRRAKLLHREGFKIEGSDSPNLKLLAINVGHLSTLSFEDVAETHDDK